MSDESNPGLEGVELVPDESIETTPETPYGCLARIARRLSASSGRENEWLIESHAGRRHGAFVAIDGRKDEPA